MEERFNPNLENVSKDLNINRISTFKKAIESMIATSKAAYVRSDSKSPRERNI